MSQSLANTPTVDKSLAKLLRSVQWLPVLACAPCFCYGVIKVKYNIMRGWEGEIASNSLV
jgi:hypothetical protein